MTKILNTPNLLPDISGISSALNFLFDDVVDTPDFSSGLLNKNSPRCNISKSDNKFLIELEAPGFEKDDISISFESGTLTVSGSLSINNDEHEIKYIKKEINKSEFKKTFKLDSTLDSSKITARFKNGLLMLELPIKKCTKTKNIKII